MQEERLVERKGELPDATSDIARELAVDGRRYAERLDSRIG